MINKNGIKVLSDRIMGRCSSFIKSINPHNQTMSKEIAAETFYDCNTLAGMIHEPEHPKWLIILLNECKLIKDVSDTNGYMNSAEKIINTMYEMKKFNWDIALAANEGGLDYDKLFNQYKTQSKLDDALEQLIKCLEIILHEPTFNFSKKTREDIKVVINSIRANKNSSDSAIRSAVASFYGFLKRIFFWHFIVNMLTINHLKDD